MPSTQSNEWSTLLLILLNKKDNIFFFWQKQIAILSYYENPTKIQVVRIYQGEFAFKTRGAKLADRQGSVYVNNAPERKGGASKYIAILTSHKSTLSPRLFTVSRLKVVGLLVSKSLLPLGHHSLHLLQWVQTGSCGNKEQSRSD